MSGALAQRIAERIAATGPITIADYMAECLLDPTDGYYTRRDPLGSAGDFTTAPEVSQMFGELVGLSLAQSWMDQGAPAAFDLVELGPGRGTLMADILRATERVPGFHAAAQLTFVEASPVLRAAQEKALPAGRAATWQETVHAIAHTGPLFLVANEFFDALPIRQFQKEGDLWRERLIGLQDGRLGVGLSGPVQMPALEARIDARSGDIVELCPSAAPIMEWIGQRLSTQGGAALIIDYGDVGGVGDTWQAVAKHTYVDPLATPGAADLTAHVQFDALARAARPAVNSVVTGQGVFLERLGITARAEALARTASGAALEQVIAAHRRLTHPDEMGTLFKVMALVAAGAPLPPGLDQQDTAPR